MPWNFKSKSPVLIGSNPLRDGFGFGPGWFRVRFCVDLLQCTRSTLCQLHFQRFQGCICPGSCSGLLRTLPTYRRSTYSTSHSELITIFNTKFSLCYRQTSYVYLHEEIMFGSKRDPDLRLKLMARMCEMLNILYQNGWRSVGSASMDQVKRRGFIVLK